MNKKLFISIGIPLLITALFVFAVSFKTGMTNLDLYLGIIWVFILSTIIAFSLSHYFVKTNYEGRNNHEH